MARRTTSVLIEVSVDEDAVRQIGEPGFDALMESIASHVRRAALGGLEPQLRALATASVGRQGIDYCLGSER
jgi:hypothetical protein